MWYRIVLFILFSVFAAPLEYHVKWAEPLVQGKVAFIDAVTQPLVSGALFFYAVIVTVEALMHLAAYPQTATRTEVRVVKILGYLLAIVPFLVYLLKGPEQPLSGNWLMFQWCVAAVSLLFAVIVRLYTAGVERHNQEA